MRKALLAVSVLFIGTQISYAQLSATINGTNPGCASNNGSATVSPTGGNSYTYKWSTGATTATVNNLGAGTYTVTVYSSAGTIWDTLYLETFDNSPAWTLNTSTGTNGADPNFWTISDNEAGVAPGGCGTAGNGNATLHVTSVFNPTGGAAYDAGGLCGVLYCPETNTAAESGNILTTGATNLVLTYDFIGAGSGLTDNASSLYSINGGTNFTQLDASLKSNNTGCTGQGKWTQRSYNLPANCIGLSNFRVRFNWTNNDDGVGTDPSVAINNVLLRDSLPGTADSVVKTVTLTLPTGPHFVTAALSVVNPGCGQSNGSINNVGVAGGAPNYTLVWETGGAQIGTGNSITNLGPGTYNFHATDANGCTIDTSFTLVTGGGGGTATISTTKPVFCANDSAQICVQGTFTSYLWNTGATSNCIWVKQAGNYYVTVTENGGCTAESNHLGITVHPLPPVSISVNGDTLSAYGAVSYQWYHNGNLISGAHDSSYIALQGGVYTVVISDANGCVATSNGITVSGLAEIGDRSPEVRLFPNPSHAMVSVFVSEALLGEDLTIYDIAGRVLRRQKISSKATALSVANLSKGIYAITIRNTVVKLVRD
jgi:hypothetical protein